MLTKEEFEKILELMKEYEFDGVYGYCKHCEYYGKHKKRCQYLRIMNRLREEIHLAQEIEDADE